jgi:hypothetical protein
MANSFTVTQIGDSFVAKTKDPQHNALSISAWEILVGVSNDNTVGKLQVTDGSTSVVGVGTNLTLQSGDQFIIGNLTFTVDNVIDANNFTITEPAPVTGLFNFYLPEDSNNYFNYQFRWSQSNLPDGGQFSEFRELTSNTGPNDLLGLTFDPEIPVWIDIRFEAERLSQGASISLLSWRFDYLTTEGVVVSCPNWCEECTDPYAMDGCANIVIDCDDALYNPYNLRKPHSYYRQLSALTNQMWGHEVRYFRVEPDQRSRDVILMEYSLYNVVEESTMKVMVPDNEFPTREFNFDIFGMDFEEFEIHITGDAFTSAFGTGMEPRSRDYLFFPILNRMYEVSTVALADQFNAQLTYWRVQLRKWEDRTSSIHTDTAIEQEVDDLTTGIEEVFGEEIQQEFEKVTKPQQFKTVYQELDDSIRYSKHPSLQIQDAEIRNKWTMISKNNYMLNKADVGERYALTYNALSKLTTSENLAITAWFRPQFTAADTTNYVFIDGREDSDFTKGLAVATTQTEMNVTINGVNYQLAYPNKLEFNVWYAVVVNVNNTHGDLSLNVYRLDPNSNLGLAHKKNSTFANFADQTFTLPSTEWNAEKGWSLSAAPLNVTNIRLFEKVIEAEQHMNVLQQYVVRDADLVIMTDNAIPSIQLRQYSNPR